MDHCSGGLPRASQACSKEDSGWLPEDTIRARGHCKPAALWPFGGPRDEAHRQDFIIAGRGPTRHIGRQRE